LIVAQLPPRSVAAFTRWHRAQPPHGANWAWPPDDHDHRGRVEAAAANLIRATRLAAEASAAYDRTKSKVLRVAAEQWNDWAEYFRVISIELGTAAQQPQEAA
jgi:hypothetical protein